MPLIEAGFLDKDGRPDGDSLRAYGPTVQVVVSPMASGDAEPKSETVYVLVDTGATESCIDKDLAERLGLPIVDVRTLSGVGGAKEHGVYAALVSIPQLEVVQYGAFTGVDLKAGGQSHMALLGRTFLSGTLLIYDGIRSQVTIASEKRT